MRILIIRIGAMGDVLHAMPAVQALRQARPDAHIQWVLEPRWLPLLRAASRGQSVGHRGPEMPLVDRVSLASTKEWKKSPLSLTTLRSVTALRHELREGAFDLCVDLQGSIRSAIIGRMAQAGGFAGPAHPREAPAAWLYGRRIRTGAEHVIDQACELLGGAVDLKLQPARVELPFDGAAEQSVATKLASLGVGDGGFVMLAPAAGWGAKQWPAERFGKVAKELCAQGLQVLVNAYAENDPLANRVTLASGNQAKIFPCDMAELIAVTRRTSLVIAGDTGPLHLAAALERPVVAIFGPTDPARNGPYGTLSRVLRRGEARRDHRRLSDPEAGLLAITVGDVLGATHDLLSVSHRPAAGEVR